MEDHGREIGIGQSLKQREQGTYYGGPKQVRDVLDVGAISGCPSRSELDGSDKKRPNTDPLRSAQPCGCDPAALHACERHTVKVTAGQMSVTGNLGSFEGIRAVVPGYPEKFAQTGVVGVDSSKFTHEPLKGIHDSGQRVTYSSGSMRDPSEGKLKWSRILFGPMARRWAQHLTTAEAKYPDVEPGVPNFTLIKTKEELLRYKESALRHFMSWYHDETNEDHASAVYFNINGVEIIKAKQRGDRIDGIDYK